ncbi:hypothetical protein Tco_0174243 [Tanacetum coccineum]
MSRGDGAWWCRYDDDYDDGGFGGGDGYDDDEDDGGSSGAWRGDSGWWWWRVEASEVVGRVDPVVGSIFGVGRKSPPEKFSGGGMGSPEIMEGREGRVKICCRREEEQTTNPSSTKKIMCTYLKNMEGKKPKDLKNKSFDSIQKMFDRAFKRVNTFVDFRIDLVEGGSKRAGEELEQESTKKQKVDVDKDTTELQSLMEVIPDEE